MYSEDQEVVSSQTNGYSQPRGESLFLALFCVQVYVPQAECGQMCRRARSLLWCSVSVCVALGFAISQSWFVSGLNISRCQATVAAKFRSSVFWDLTRRRSVINRRRFWTTYRSVVEGQEISGTTVRSETSVTNYQPTPRKIPKQRRYGPEKLGVIVLFGMASKLYRVLKIWSWLVIITVQSRQYSIRVRGIMSFGLKYITNGGQEPWTRTTKL